MTFTKDLLSGLIFLAIGAFMVIEAQSYEMGTLLRMGPGYFPTAIGALIFLVGLILSLNGLTEGAEKLPQFNFRPLLVLLAAILAFAFSLETAGLIVATTLLVLIGRMASRNPINWVGTIVLCACLVGTAIVIFWYFLELPLKLWP